ncbi:MAG: class III signal peptide-containing protein [Candidatus Omnitrophica bacterium]|nr:class III signal peptide-containing protein [Candidatus Omnitrophota bacterium]
MFRNINGSKGSPRDKLGQSTVEYIILVTAVIAVVILFVANPGTGFQKKVNSTLETATQGMEDKGAFLSTSHNTAPGNSDLPQINVDITSNLLP